MAWAVTFGTPAALQILCTHFRGQSRQCSPKSAAFGSRPFAERTRYGCRKSGTCNFRRPARVFESGIQTFNEVVHLAYDPVPTGPNILFTITYRHGLKACACRFHGASGSLFSPDRGSWGAGQ